MNDVHISDEYRTIDRENVNGNIRRPNPFKAKDRVAFPPFDEALDVPNKQLNHATTIHPNTSCSGSPGWMNLTIGMQALIHPDSFCEDQASVSSEESHISHPWADLSSPDRTGDSTIFHIDVPGPSICNVETKEKSICFRAPLEMTRGQSDGASKQKCLEYAVRKAQENKCVALNDSSDSFDETPCMADIFAAFSAASRDRHSKFINHVIRSESTVLF
jgi:hypothetical protein